MPLIVGLMSILSIGAAVWPACASQTAARQTVSVVRGRALFVGTEPLVGRIREHQDDMPAAVVACSNCHAFHNRQAVKGSDAPVLSAAFLNARRSRRRGPESAYDERSFCRVLRTSTDPVYILLDHTMPTYDLTDAQCQSLWRFLQDANTITTGQDRSHP